MSTYWYFECLDHTPALVSDSEFTQHTDDKAFKNAMSLAAERPVLPMHEMPNTYRETLDDSRMYFETNARRFLIQHPGCQLGVRNEYGERRRMSEQAVGTIMQALNSHGIKGNDATTALAHVLRIVGNTSYAEWLSGIRSQINESVSDEERDRRIASQYGHDAVRAILALADSIEVQP